MSTIIIPGGGGRGLGIASIIGNLVALAIMVAVVKYFWQKVSLPKEPINVVDTLKKYNIDVTGLFGTKKENYYPVDEFLQPGLKE